MTTSLEEKIKYYDDEYRAGRALIKDKQFDQLERNLLRIDPKSDYFTKKKLFHFHHFQKTKFLSF